MPLIPVSQIRMGEFVQNCRDRQRAEAIDDGLLQSILANGLIQPVEVRPRREVQDGRKIMVYDLTAGERRVRHILHILEGQPKAFRDKFSEDGAPLKLFWDGKQAFVEATFFRGSDVEAQIRNLEENRHREDLLPSELARGIQLVRQKGGTYADAAEVVGLGLKKVEELHRWFQNATAELRQATDEGAVPMDVSNDVAEAPPEKQREFVEEAKKIEKAEPRKREAKKKLNDVARRVTGREKPAKPKKSPPKFTPAAGVSVANEKVQVTARLGGHTEDEIRSLLEQVEAKMPEVKKSLRSAKSGTPAWTRCLKAQARLEAIAEALRFILGQAKELPL
ncbi:hypothetical protein FJY63_00045 [Candidatus Sumerlaeota bacterium]|nr:hypothetical protein [Candidatus Sumerlaeota bacterium]